MKLPSLIIVADRGHLVAYRLSDSGRTERIESAEFVEGSRKLSELVTDQAGAFPTGSPGSPGTSHAERLPLEAELEMRSFRQIAAKVRELVDRENPVFWGFAAPSEINGAILDGLDDDCHRRLAVNLKLDLIHHPATEVAERFLSSRSKARVETP